jgi:hypothetical protein
MRTYPSLTLGALGATLVLSGCMIEKHHHKGDGNDDVSVRTPLGGVDVKHDASAGSLGLPVYPGATLDKDDKKDDSSSANVHIGFGAWQFHVEAISYRTSDPEPKVEAFYRGPLAHYGTVITCRDGRPVQPPNITDQGLNCSDKRDIHGAQANFNFDNSGDLELRTGSPRHQRIVSLTSDAGGTHIKLVQLDLPHGLDRESDAQ